MPLRFVAFVVGQFVNLVSYRVDTGVLVGGLGGACPPK